MCCLGGAAALEVDLQISGRRCPKTVEYIKIRCPHPCAALGCARCPQRLRRLHRAHLTAQGLRIWLLRGSRKLGYCLTAAARARRSPPVMS